MVMKRYMAVMVVIKRKLRVKPAVGAAVRLSMAAKNDGDGAKLQDGEADD